MGGVPPKSGLGRGLGTLLREAQQARTPSADTGKADAERPPLSPGMATLLRGANGKTKAAPAPFQPKSRLRTLRATLAAADLLLCGLVAWLAFYGPRPWGTVEVLMCVVAVGTGAWLAYLAFSLPGD